MIGVITDKFRVFIPTAFLLGIIPVLYVFWFCWRIVTAFLPVWLFQKGDDFVFSIYQRLVLFFYEHFLGTELYLYGDAKDLPKKKERVLYISNHQSDVDWVVADMIAARHSSVGQLRYVLKDSIQMLPIFGHALYQHGCIYVKRGNFNESKMKESLKYLQDPNINSWIVVFPEGTRFDPTATEVVKCSQTFAKDQGLNPLTHLLSPRSRGVSLALSTLRGHFDAVYDVTIVYEGTKQSNNNEKGRIKTPNMFEFLLLRQPRLHVHIKRIPLDSVPQEDADLKTWLHQLFVEKEKFLSNYYDSKESVESATIFDGCGELSSLSKLETFPVFLLFLALVMLTCWFAVGRHLYWRALLFGIVSGYFWLAVKAVAQ